MMSQRPSNAQSLWPLSPDIEWERRTTKSSQARAGRFELTHQTSYGWLVKKCLQVPWACSVSCPWEMICRQWVQTGFPSFSCDWLGFASSASDHLGAYLPGSGSFLWKIERCLCTNELILDLTGLVLVPLITRQSSFAVDIGRSFSSAIKRSTVTSSPIY